MALALVALVVVSICHGSFHGVSSVPVSVTATPNINPSLAPVPLSTAAREFLESHNQARAQVGVAPLVWSENLANATSRLVRYQRINKGCEFANLTAGKYGANQSWGSGGVAVTPRMAVDSWVNEKNYYNHSDNSCKPNHMCGVYTQVVWRKSLELGCGQAFCSKDQATLTICFYNPPGNYVGESPY